MMSRPVVLLLQLSPPRAYAAEAHDNEPLGLGNLAAWYQIHSLSRAYEIRIAPADWNDRAGDAALLARVVAQAPAVVGLSLFCWNLLRSLSLASALRAVLPETLLVAGGPEVTADNDVLLGSGSFDFLVLGEGERPFTALLDALAAGTSWQHFVPDGLVVRAKDGYRSAWKPDRGVALDELPSPHLHGILPIGTTVRIETARGCHRRCAYCFYSRHASQRSTLSLEQLATLFTYARAHGGREVFLADPELTQRQDLDHYLKGLAAANRGSELSLFAELSAEQITPARAALLREAGVKGVEVGLQSTNPEALRAVGRSWREKRFSRGLHALREAGLAVTVDAIVGLPHDGSAEIAATIAYLVGLGFRTETQVFPLALLPGTRLRAEALRHGYRREQFPPYLVVESSWLAPAEVSCVLAECDDKLGGGYDSRQPPRLSPLTGAEESDGWLFERGGAGYLERIVVKAKDLRSRPSRLTADLSSFLTLWVRGLVDEEDLEATGALVRDLHASNPHGVLDIVLELRKPLSTGVLQAFSTGLPSTAGHYLDQRALHHDPARAASGVLLRLLAPPRSPGSRLRAWAEDLPGVDILAVLELLPSKLPGQAVFAMLDPAFDLFLSSPTPAGTDLETIVTAQLVDLGFDPTQLHFGPA